MPQMMRLTVLVTAASLWACCGAWAQSGPLVLPQPGGSSPDAAAPAMTHKPAAKPKPPRAPKPRAADAPAAEAPGPDVDAASAPAGGAGETANAPQKAAATPARSKPARPVPPPAAEAAQAPEGDDAQAAPQAPAPKPAAARARAKSAAPARPPVPSEAAASPAAPGEDATPPAGTPPQPTPPGGSKRSRSKAAAAPPPAAADGDAAASPEPQPIPSKAPPRDKANRSKAAASAARAKPPEEPAREVPPPLRAADLRDPDLLTDGRLLGQRSSATVPPATGDNPTPVVTRSMGRSPRSLYLAETLSPPGVAVYDALLQAPDSSEAAPVALNSFEAVQAGAPAGPFRAGLVEENEAEPGRPRIDGGTVTWRYIQPDGGTGAPTALSAEVVIDRQRLKVVMTFRPDRSPNAPSPLAIDVAFVNTQSPVTQIGVPELRNPGIERGVPLYATIAGGMKPGEPFTIVLSTNDSDGDQNVKLLTARPWIDVPFRTQGGQRLTLAFEKGTAVREMMRSAFSAWRLPWLP